MQHARENIVENHPPVAVKQRAERATSGLIGRELGPCRSLFESQHGVSALYRSSSQHRENTAARREDALILAVVAVVHQACVLAEAPVWLDPVNLQGRFDDHLGVHALIRVRK